MTTVRWYRLSSVFLLLAASALAGPTRAGIAAADANLTPVAAAGTPAGATHDLLAYSYAAGIGTNVTKTDSFLGVGLAVTRFGDEICVPALFFLSTCYSPPVGFRDRAKPAPATGVRSVSSDTPAPPFAAFGAHGQASYTPPLAAGAAGRLLAGASLVGVPNAVNPSAEAAAEARDPFDLDPGLYDYFYTINGISLQNDEEDGIAGVSFFATDSRFSDPLWELAVIARGIIGDPADLYIDFYSDPSLGLDDLLVQSAVRGAFTVAAGLAVLTGPFELFHTTYSVDSTIRYSEGLNAGLAAPVPEPGTWALLACAAGLLASTMRRRGLCRRARAPGRR